MGWNLCGNRWFQPNLFIRISCIVELVLGIFYELVLRIIYELALHMIYKLVLCVDFVSVIWEKSLIDIKV